MAAPQSTPLPEAPTRGEAEGQFVPKANAFVGALEPFRQQLQAQADFVNERSTETEENAALAQDASEMALSSANFAGDWSGLSGAFDVPTSVLHDDTYWQLLEDVSNIQDDEPGVSDAWAPINVARSSVRSLSGIAELDSLDTSKLLDGQQFSVKDGGQVRKFAWDEQAGEFQELTYANTVYPLPDITALSSLDTAALVDGQQISAGEFWPGTGVGGGALSWRPDEPKANHNGGTIIDPDKVIELGSIGEFNGYFTPAGSGVGCWVRTSVGHVTALDFGAITGGAVETQDAIRAAIVGARGHKKLILGPHRYLVTSQSVGPDEGDVFTLTEEDSGLLIDGQGATLVHKSNRLQVFVCMGAKDVSFRGITFDNSANGLIQNTAKGAPMPNGGVAGIGNNANAAIVGLESDGLSVRDCEFRSINLATGYDADYQDDQVQRGHFDASNLRFINCCFGMLINTPATYRIDRCESYQTKDSINAESEDPGHMIYVTDRQGAVPKSGIITNIYDEGGESTVIKVRKGDNVVISDVSSYGSRRGIELWGIKTGSLTNAVVELGDLGGNNNSCLELVDCGDFVVSGGSLNFERIDAWGIRVRSDLDNLPHHNRGISIIGVSMVADFSGNGSPGKAPVFVSNQREFFISHPKITINGSVQSIRAAVDIRGSSQRGIINRPAVFYEDWGTTGRELVRFEGTTFDNRAIVSAYDSPDIRINPPVTMVVDDSAGENEFVQISDRFDVGSASSPSITFHAAPDTGMFRPAPNSLGVSAGGVEVSRAISNRTEFYRRVELGEVIQPINDDEISCGSGSRRFTEIFATSGVVNTSDAREKQQITPLSVSERRVARELAGLVRKFRWNREVSQYGDDAKWHFGVIAQEVVAAFARHGLDALDYGLVKLDSWPAQGSVRCPETGVELEPARAAGDRYGVRYPELSLFVLGALYGQVD